MDGFEYNTNINPNIVLAMHTTSPQLYKKYLENAARADHEAVGRLLKVSLDYTAAMKSLYPNELPMMTPAMRASMNNVLHSDDVVQLFCEPSNPTCNNILSTILPTVTHAGARIDLFFVGKPTRAQIIGFAKANNISNKAVHAHQITLNFGDEPFKALESSVGHKLPTPYLLVRRDGQSIPVVLGGQSE